MSRLTRFVTPVGMCMTNLNSMEHYMPCVPCRHKAEMKIDANGKGYTEKYSYCDTCEVKMLFNKLKRYEDLEEQGRLAEVIRCKDCIRYGDEYVVGAGWCDEHEHLTNDDDYCSYAVAKLAEMEGAE